MRLLVSLVLTTLVASAFAQEVPTVPTRSSVIHLFPQSYSQLSRSAVQDYRAQIEAVNELPNVDVQLVDENTFTAVGDAAEETAAVVDPSSVIVSAVNDAVETIVESLTLDAPVAEEEVSEVDETVPDDEPMLQPVRAETAAPDPADMEDDEPALDTETPLLTVAEPEPEPPTTDTQGDAEFAAKPEPKPVAPIEEDIVPEIVEVEEPRKPTKKELKAVEKFNEAVDNIANILSQRLGGEDALPLEVDEEVLEELDAPPPTTLPPTTTTTTTLAPVTPEEKVCPAKWVDKCLDEKCKGKSKCLEKCKKKNCATEKKEKKKIKNKNKKNKNNKKNNRKGNDNNKNNKKNNKNNKNKNNKKINNKNKNNKNNRRNRNKNIRMPLFRTRGENRQSKDLEFDDTDDTEDIDVQGRRKGDNPTEKKNKGQRKGNGKNKNKNKNKKKNSNKTRSEDLPVEAKDKYVPKSAEPGPLFASLEEFSASSAMIMGFSHIRREGDVVVDLSGRHPRFTATMVMGPLNVLLTKPKSSLRKSEVTTELRARMLFTAKEARRRNKLSINEVVVEIPDEESVSVFRSDLDLEPEIVSAAQDEVSSAIDTDRIARIIHQTVAAAFEEDNIMQNLEDHPALMSKAHITSLSL